MRLKLRCHHLPDLVDRLQRPHHHFEITDLTVFIEADDIDPVDRDPVKLGEALLALPGRGKLSERYDKHHVQLLAVDDYPHDYSLVQETVAAYKAEFPDGIPVVNDDPGGA